MQQNHNKQMHEHQDCKITHGSLLKLMIGDKVSCYCLVERELSEVVQLLHCEGVDGEEDVEKDGQGDDDHQI